MVQVSVKKLAYTGPAEKESVASAPQSKELVKKPELSLIVIIQYKPQCTYISSLSIS